MKGNHDKANKILQAGSENPLSPSAVINTTLIEKLIINLDCIQDHPTFQQNMNHTINKSNHQM